MIIGGWSLQTPLVREIHAMWKRFQLDLAPTLKKKNKKKHFTIDVWNWSGCVIEKLWTSQSATLEERSDLEKDMY